MHWPTPQDYNEAIQNARTCFADSVLKNSAVELNALGLPRPITGAFASVYRVQAGGQYWAVRCFLHPITDQHERYSALSRFIINDDFQFTIPFHYIEKGILVKGKWYPILQMQWVDGLTLDTWLREAIPDQSHMEWAASKFLSINEMMQQAGIAHGDLQHGNIIVSDDDMYLVDYDGMFIPELRGWLSNELGHRNYQHPGRTKEDFGPNLDNFSAQLIYWSLKMLAQDPRLLPLLNPDNEGLLLFKEDFLNPVGSDRFRYLEHHPSAEVVAAAKFLRHIALLPRESVPPLNGECYLPHDLPKLEPLAANELAINNSAPNTTTSALVLPRAFTHTSATGADLRQKRTLSCASLQPASSPQQPVFASIPNKTKLGISSRYSRLDRRLKQFEWEYRQKGRVVRAAARFCWAACRVVAIFLHCAFHHGNASRKTQHFMVLWDFYANDIESIAANTQPSFESEGESSTAIVQLPRLRTWS